MLSAADRAALLVPAKTLRRLVERDRRLGFFAGRVKRRTSYVISEARLAPLAEELAISRPEGSSSPWLIVAAPEPEEWGTTRPERILHDTWRRLYRAKIESEAAAKTDGRTLRVRLERIDPNDLQEIRNVLKADGLLFDASDDEEVHRTFIAYYCELTMFAPSLIRHALPSLENTGRIRDWIAEIIDPAALLAATRLEGTADRLPASNKHANSAYKENESSIDVDAFSNDPDLAESTVPIRGSARLRHLQSAWKALKQGNAVRAAIVFDIAARHADRGSTTIKSDLRAASAALEQLATRLQAALFFRKGEIRQWTDALNPLLRRASRGFWTHEARLLYDLQKVCIDFERETYRIDLLPWIFSRGRRPLKTPLPHLREVMMSKHLRSALERLNQVKLARDDRNRLESLLKPAVRQAETTLRKEFRSKIVDALNAHWVAPTNLPEHVAYNKLVEELLDRIVEHGFLSLGDLRDFASRSNLKLPDLKRPADFFEGNHLLKTDKALSIALDGVHRRGEIYLRWLQRFSSLAFATPLGRFVSLYIALPYGGAFVLLEGLQHLVNAVAHLFTTAHFELMNRWGLLTIGSLALGAINFMRFRRDFLGLVRVALRSVRRLVYDWPAWVLNNPWLLRALKSRFVTGLWQVALKPAVFSTVAPILAFNFGANPKGALIAWGTATALGSLMVNTKSGRRIEYAILEALGRLGHAIVHDWVPGLFHLIMNSFHHMLEGLDKVLYAVDEWLRFRDGQSQAALVIKGTIGLFWFGVAYLARIYVNLLIEPQINPIKHFPVVTVSHKVILPMTIPLTRILSAPLKPFLGVWLGNAVAGLNVLLLPGVFGFLVWELKANWRLYEANRSQTLDPLMVGSHGETIVRLLRPGFHSGTLPRAFAKLRRGEVSARNGSRERTALKPLTTIHHAEESIRHFVDRELLSLFQQSGDAFGKWIVVGSIKLATNRIGIELIAGREDQESLRLNLDERNAVLWAKVAEPGWLTGLSDQERTIVENAFAGFYKMCGVQRVDLADSCESTANGSTAKITTEIDFAAIEVFWADWVKVWGRNPSAAGEANTDTEIGTRSRVIPFTPIPLTVGSLSPATTDRLI